MGRHSDAEIDLEKRMQASGIFDDMSQENFKEKLELFLDSEPPEQAVKDIEIVENIQRRDLTPIEEARSYKNLLDKGYLTQEQLAENRRLQLELEVYQKYANDTRVLTAVDKFMNADMKDRDAALTEVIRVLNNAKNKYDMMKIKRKIKEGGRK